MRKCQSSIIEYLIKDSSRKRIHFLRIETTLYHLVSSIFLPWNFACTCKRHHPFACFDKWTTSSLIPLTDLFQPSWFHSINFQSQRSLCSPTAYIVSPLNGFHAYLRSPSFFILLTFYSLSLSLSLHVFSYCICDARNNIRTENFVDIK